MSKYSIGSAPNIRKAGLRTSAALLGAALCNGSVCAPADAGQGRLLSTETGHSLIVRGNDISRVAVGDAKIAGVVPLGKHEIVVNGKTPGETTIFVWDGGVRQAYELTVTDDGLDQVLRVLRTAIDDPDVRLMAVGPNVVVSGDVADIDDYNRVNEIIAHFNGIKFRSAAESGASGGGGEGKIPIINALRVQRPLGDLEQQLGAIPGTKNLRVDLDADGNVIVSGRVSDRQQEQAVIDKIDGLAGPYLKTNGKIVDRLAMDSSSQIDVKVDVLEVDKTAQSTLGLALGAAQPTSGLGSNGAPIPPYTINSTPAFTAVDSPVQSGLPGKALTVGAFLRVSLLAPTLNLLITQGHARRLSSPNLVTKPGKEATFLVGGEIPIPVANGLGTVSIDYKQYGVQLRVTPTIGPDGSVDSDITPEVSDLDFADAITVGGFTVPAFKTSRIQTDVTTQDGQSVIMGGLLRRIEQKNVQKIPLLGDLPILGALFRSTAYQRTDTDVVFVLTPTVITSRRPPSAQIIPRSAHRAAPTYYYPPIGAPSTPAPASGAPPAPSGTTPENPQGNGRLR